MNTITSYDAVTKACVDAALALGRDGLRDLSWLSSNWRRQQPAVSSTSYDKTDGGIHDKATVQGRSRG